MASLVGSPALLCQNDSTDQPKKSEAEPSHGVTPPRIIRSVDVEYDKASRKEKVQGKVVLTLVVAKSGEPRDIKITKSLNPALDEKAIEAVSKWRFNPGMKNGEPVSVRINLEVNFRLY
jgi:protein TonB